MGGLRRAPRRMRRAGVLATGAGSPRLPVYLQAGGPARDGLGHGRSRPGGCAAACSNTASACVTGRGGKAWADLAPAPGGDRGHTGASRPLAGASHVRRRHGRAPRADAASRLAARRGLPRRRDRARRPPPGYRPRRTATASSMGGSSRAGQGAIRDVWWPRPAGCDGRRTRAARRRARGVRARGPALA